MPRDLNYRPTDPGLEQAFQTALPNARQGDGLTQALSVATGLPLALANAKKSEQQKALLAQLVRDGVIPEGLDISSPEQAAFFENVLASQKGAKMDAEKFGEAKRAAGVNEAGAQADRDERKRSNMADEQNRALGLSDKINGKQSKADESMWKEINRRTNPNVAPRGSLLGAAGTNNARADRALANLNDPNMVVQQLDAVTTDVAGIMQGGAPHDQGMAKMGFTNVLTKWATLKSQIMSSPQAINNPAVVEKLRQIVQEIKDVDNKIIKDNLDIAEVDYGEAVARNPSKWQKHRDAVMKTTGGLGAMPAAPAAQTGAPQEGMVSVISPDGKKGKLPFAKVAEAIKRGYTVAQ